jgi:hypothetical protein
MGNVDLPEQLLETTAIETVPAKPKLTPEEEEQLAAKIKKHEDEKKFWKGLCIAKFPHLEEIKDHTLDSIIEIYMKDNGKRLGKINNEDRQEKKKESKVKKTSA